MSNRLAVNLLFFINGFVFANWASRIPRLQDDYGMDNKVLGFVLLAHSIGAFIAMPISGWLILKQGSKNITAISAILFCLFFITVPLASDRFTIMLPFLLMGASTGVMDVAMNAQAVIVETDIKKPIMTFFHGMWSIGVMLGGLSGSAFTSMGWTLQPQFLVVGALGLSVILVSIKFLHPDQQNTENPVGQFLVWPKGPVIILGAIAFCCMLGEGAMADWSANYLKNSMGANETIAALGLTAFAFCMTLGRLVGDQGRLYIGDKKLLRICAVISLLGISTILIHHSIPVSIAGFGLVGLGLSIVVPIVYSLSGSFPGIPPGVGIAMSTTIGYAGFMIGPPSIGFLADATDVRTALCFVALLFLIMTVLIFRYERK